MPWAPAGVHGMLFVSNTHPKKTVYIPKNYFFTVGILYN